MLSVDNVDTFERLAKHWVPRMANISQGCDPLPRGFVQNPQRFRTNEAIGLQPMRALEGFDGSLRAWTERAIRMQCKAACVRDA